MDGRDTAPDSGAGHIAQLEQKMREYGVGKVATVSGRYYAMDRDQRWSASARPLTPWSTARPRAARTSTPWTASRSLTTTASRRVPDSLRDRRRCWPAVARIRDEDVCINFNFRADRAREITAC